MPYPTKLSFSTLLFIMLLPFWGKAQENIAPIKYNPFAQPNIKNNIARYAKTSALALPFFEDFTNYNSDPDSSRWVERQVYINNTMGHKMISRGVATFDALNQYGLPYDTVNINTIRNADSLSSKAIDLSGFVSSDSLYLSFFYQPAGNGFTPEKEDSLMLYFKAKTGTTWVKVWAKSDSVLRDFKQVLIAVADPKYLHSNFQFRFINKASIGINDDIWNVDYIQLAAGRNQFDTLTNDVAFTNTPNSILKDYEAMPYAQYTADPSREKGADFQTIIRNNYTTNQTVSNYGYNASLLGSGATLASDAGFGRFINARDTTKISFGTYNSTPSASVHERVVFENKFYLQAPAGDVSTTNDSIVGQQVFDNYLAYDDGTAEMSYYLNLFPTLPGKIAIEHHLNAADTLRGVAIYFGRQVPLATYKYFSIVVYKNIAYGSSSADDIIYQIDNLQPGYMDTVNHFWIYKFDKPVLLPKGTFYIGTTQPALSGSDSLYFGLDRNRTKNNHLYYNVLNTWSPSLVSGALMIRPLLGGAIKGTNIEDEKIISTNELGVFPNPTRDILNIQIATEELDFSFSVKNILGQVSLQGNSKSKNHKIDMSGLISGVYFLEISTATKHFPIQTIIKQ